MYYVRWTIRIVFFLIVGAFLHYTLPDRDIVRVNGTEILRQDFTGWNRIFYAQADSGNDNAVLNRDLRLINTQRANGRSYVYRNEDTGFGWPPYFKLDSSNLQSDAQAAARADAEQWYVVRHYGWRNEFLTIYPNAISIRPIAGPDVRLIPYFNIAVVVFLFALYWAISVRLRRFWDRRIGPIFDGE
ncbi:MAG: DUF1523 family protein [Pseudomonadota bacterium]